MSEGLDGLAAQGHAALVANLLLTLRAGERPTKRTAEMFCPFFLGWGPQKQN